MIKAVIFDNFGVLTTDMWRAFLGTIPENLVDIARQINRERDSGIISNEEFAEQIEQLTGRQPESVENTVEGDIVKNAALLDYIRELKSSYKIGMISNISSNWIRDSFLSAEEQALFDDMVFSFEVKITKPDPRIYHLACERLQVQPVEVVIIDDIESYCQTVQAEGMKAIHFQDNVQLKRELTELLSQV